MTEQRTALDVLSGRIPLARVGKSESIYLLIKDNEVVYVGRSVDEYRRVWQHKKTKHFDDAAFFVISSDRVSEVEEALIAKIRPKGNIQIRMMPQKADAVLRRSFGEDFVNNLNKPSQRVVRKLFYTGHKPSYFVRGDKFIYHKYEVDDNFFHRKTASISIACLAVDGVDGLTHVRVHLKHRNVRLLMDVNKGGNVGMDSFEKQVLGFLAEHQGQWSTFGGEPSQYMPTILTVMHRDTFLRRMQGLIDKGFIGGCACGCRGDFEITDLGLKAIGKPRTKDYRGYGHVRGSVWTGSVGRLEGLHDAGYGIADVKYEPSQTSGMVSKTVTFKKGDYLQ